MKSCLALLLFLSCGLVSCLNLEKDDVQPALEVEQLLQDNDAASVLKQELLEEEREQEEHPESQATLEDVVDTSEPPPYQLSSFSCHELFSGGWCRDFKVAHHCERTCCSDALSKQSCEKIKNHPDGCKKHLFKFGTCRKSCRGCWIDIFLHSEGCNDVGIQGCGRGKIYVNGHDYSLHRRGHNIVVIDRFGKLLKQASFDTYGNSSSGRDMSTFIRSIRYGSYVLIATQDSANNYVSEAIPALKSLGAKHPFTLGFRSSWAFVGLKGYHANSNLPFIRQAAKPRYRGPTKLGVKINIAPIYYRPRPIGPRPLK